METIYFITHPDVLIDPNTPVPDWRLSATGLARMRAMLAQNWVSEIRYVASSAERKALDGADILARHLGLTISIHPELGENDRSSIGYLPRPEFEAMADAFFARPDESVRGWERAVDAQARIVDAVRKLARMAPPGDVAIVSHGGVGALLLCHALGDRISREADQPAGAGGWFLTLDREGLALRHGWRPIDG